MQRTWKLCCKMEFGDEAAELEQVSFNKKTSHNNQNHILDENGIRYLTLFVKSMTSVLERIKKHGVKTPDETPILPDEIRQFVLIQDIDGYFVEFIGPK